MAANNNVCTQHVQQNDPLMRGHIGLYDAHYDQFSRFFADTKYNPKILVQNLRDVNWPELAAAFADAFVPALLCRNALTKSGQSADDERDITEEFGFLNKLAAAMAFNQAEVEFLPQWYSESLATDKKQKRKKEVPWPDHPMYNGKDRPGKKYTIREWRGSLAT